MKSLLILLLLAAAGFAQQNVVVYKESGRFAGWPANHGIWSWNNEIVVGFEAGYFKVKGEKEHREHAIDYSKPEEHMLARSLDGGLTWKMEAPPSLQPPEGTKIAGVPAKTGGKPAVESMGGIRFTDPNFAMTFRMEDIHLGPSRFYYSYDRGKTWEGAFKVPDFGQKGIAARTDYIVNGPKDCMVFLTAAKSNGREGRVIMVRTTDGGKSWKFVAYVTPEPEGNDHAIMPSTVRLSPKSLYTAVRFRQFIDGYQSDDNGSTWHRVGRIADTDNPPSLLKLKDGRLAIAYGYRKPPFGLRGRVSKDQGKTWGDEIILRQDGGSWDLGYPRSALRPDGKIVTAYYFNEGAERYIGATIWDPK
ncbi:MAG: sialidase family protein [Bryobacteraceae bacterium]